MSIGLHDSSLGATEEPDTAQEGPLGTVLVVDDDNSVRMLLVALLRREGYSVKEARNGEEAKGLLRGELPSVILSDLEMPTCNGWDLLLFCQQRFPSVPVVLMSGHAFGLRPEVERYAVGLLPKPFGRAELRLAIDHAFFHAATRM